MSRVLITGGAGFIGSRLAQELSERGHTVTVLDSLLPKIHGPAPAQSPLVQRASQHARVLRGDVTSPDDVRAAVRGQDAIVHLAAETGTGESMYQIEHYTRVNVGGTATLLEVLGSDDDRTVQKVLVASSRSIYGEGSYETPDGERVSPDRRHESDLMSGLFDVTHPGAGPLRMIPTAEDAKLHPSSVYGITKQMQESLVMTVAPTIGVAGVALRYQNVYGPGQSLTNPYTGILSIFSTRIRQGKPINIFEDGLESRDFVYIDDVVTATAEALESDTANDRVFNVGSGVATTVNEVVTELMSALGTQVPVDISGNFRLGDIRHNVADISQIRTALGWSPRVSFAEGLANFVSWVQTQAVTDGGYERSLAEMRQKNLLK